MSLDSWSSAKLTAIKEKNVRIYLYGQFYYVSLRMEEYQGIFL